MTSSVRRVKTAESSVKQTECTIQVVGEYKPPKAVAWKQQSFKMGPLQTVLLNVGALENPFYSITTHDTRGSLIHYIYADNGESASSVLIQNLIDEERDITVSWML